MMSFFEKILTFLCIRINTYMVTFMLRSIPYHGLLKASLANVRDVKARMLSEEPEITGLTFA